MNKILIPTDFSPVADNALDYAIELAAKFKSELLLYNVYSMNKRIDYDWDFPKNEQPFIKKIEQRMNFTKGKFIEKITQKGLSIKTKIEECHIYSLFNQIPAKHNINLIVMGSKGASGLEKVIFGSVAGTALDLAEVPVLVVPPNHSFHTLEHIVLAIDLNEVATRVLLPLQKLAFTFGAKVTILYVDKGSNKERQKKMDLTLKDVETDYLEVPMSKNINETINEFIEINKSDLLCMVRREKGFFESLFQKSITKDQVYNSSIPFLVLPEIIY
jgi:nucleotide-binding universal stress UspA family protein